MDRELNIQAGMGPVQSFEVGTPSQYKPLDLQVLLKALESTVVIPVVPYRDRAPNLEGLSRNLDFLIQNNYLDGDRQRVVAFGGTSMIHHISRNNWRDIISAAGKIIADRGILVSGILSNPIEDVADEVRYQSTLSRPPDAYMLMPMLGVTTPASIRTQYEHVAETLVEEGRNPRFILYMQNPTLADVYADLVRNSPYFIGIKVGDKGVDVEKLINDVDGQAVITWGMGDDGATNSAKAGTRGHTSGIANFAPFVSDMMNNAYRSGDFDSSARLEKATEELEIIRAMEGRRYNVSALLYLMSYLNSDQFTGGDNTAPANNIDHIPQEIRARIEKTALELVKLVN